VVLLKEGNSELIMQLNGVASASREECSIELIDITERKRAVDDLLASEWQFRAIFELFSIGKAIDTGLLPCREDRRVPDADSPQPWF
jgi:PAS domain-containing protein